MKRTIQRYAPLLTVLLALTVPAAPQAQARLYAEYNDDRLSLVGEHLYAVGSLPYICSAAGNWRYPASDFGAYLAYARSGLAAYMTVRNYTFATWSDTAIRELLNGAEPGWAGQCFSYVALLLLRSGDTDGRHLLQSYNQLARAAKPLRSACWGDILFRTGRYSHTMLVLWVDAGGCWVGDSNFQYDERVRTHYMSWQQLGTYRLADLNALLRVLGSR